MDGNVEVSDGQPTADTFSDGQPTADTFSDGQPTADTFSDGQPTADTFSDGQPTADTLSDGQPTADTLSDRQHTADTFSDGQHTADQSGAITATLQSTVTPQQHHEQYQLCLSRPQYRQGRKLTSVKVYTVNDESIYLIITGVPAIKLHKELCCLCKKYGEVSILKKLEDYPSQAFSDVFLVKYYNIKEARFAKKVLDGKNFYGGVFHVFYAPELETPHETRFKLFERTRAVKVAIARKMAVIHAADGGNSVLYAYHPDDGLASSIRRISHRMGCGAAVSDGNQVQTRNECSMTQHNDVNGGRNESNGYSDTSHCFKTPNLQSPNHSGCLPNCSSNHSSVFDSQLSLGSEYFQSAEKSTTSTHNLHGVPDASFSATSYSYSSSILGAAQGPTSDFVQIRSSGTEGTSRANLVSLKTTNLSYSSVPTVSSDFSSTDGSYASQSATYEPGIGELDTELYSAYTKTTYKKTKTITNHSHRIKNLIGPRNKSRDLKHGKKLQDFSTAHKQEESHGLEKRGITATNLPVRAKRLRLDPTNPRAAVAPPNYTKVLVGPRQIQQHSSRDQLSRLQELLDR